MCWSYVIVKIKNASICLLSCSLHNILGYTSCLIIGKDAEEEKKKGRR